MSKKQLYKTLLFVSILALIVFAFSGCGNESTGSEPLMIDALIDFMDNIGSGFFDTFYSNYWGIIGSIGSDASGFAILISVLAHIIGFVVWIVLTFLFLIVYLIVAIISAVAFVVMAFINGFTQSI